MVEYIEVRYKKIVIGEYELPAYHKYFVYNDSNGDKWYARTGPATGNTPYPGPIAWGFIKAETGEYLPGTIDYDDEGNDPYEVVAAGTDLSDYWTDIVYKLNEIENGVYEYQPLGQNSNSSVDAALDYAGLPSASLDDTYRSPGSNLDLDTPWLLGLPGLIIDWMISGAGMNDNAPRVYSPLVLDLDGDGIETTKMGYGVGASTVYFDLDNDGFSERTGWVTGGDGLLAIDINSNGKIDNQSELFGNSSTHADGFAKLDTYDSNSDNKITSADANWALLKVWVDSDGDGITDSGELHSLSSLNISQINLTTTPHTNLYNNENLVTASSTFVIGGLTRTVSDVWFRHDNVDTRFTGDVTLLENMEYMPTLKGYGLLKDLHFSMSENEDLLAMVADLYTTWSIERFSDNAALNHDIEDIIFEWAEVSNVSPTSRGIYVDGQKLAFLEKYFGEAFVSYNGHPNPDGQSQADRIDMAFNYVFLNLKAMLIMQIAGEDFFETTPTYSVVSGGLTSEIVSSSALSAFTSEANASIDRTAYWKAVAEMYLMVKDYPAYSSAESTALNNAIQSSLPSSSWYLTAWNARPYMAWTANPTDFSDLLGGGNTTDSISGGGGNDIISGYAGDDTLAGNDGDDLLYGGYGNDSLNGGDGNDKIYGEHDSDGITAGAGNDELIGGSGNDTLRGGTGDDIYYFDLDFGQDIIDETFTTGGGNDIIQFGEGITIEDLRFVRSSPTDTDLYIYIGLDRIRLYNQLYDQHNGTSTYDEIETIRFSDNSTYNLLTTPFVFKGTSSGEYVYATKGNDTLIGLTGNDQLQGGEGNDIYFFDTGFGQDVIDETSVSAGATSIDEIRFGDGITFNDLRFVRTSPTDSRLYIYVNETDRILIYDQFYDETYGGNNRNEIETIRFSDNSTFNLIGGDFTFKGTSSGEYVYATKGNDTLIGLAGNDQLQGGEGNDIYFFDTGFGQDVIDETSVSVGATSIDEIRFGAGITLENLRFWHDGNSIHLKIYVGTDLITIYNQFYDLQYGGNSYNEIEFIRFADNSIYDLATNAHTYTGTSSAENMYGTNGNDTIVGLGGNDNLNGFTGNDTYMFNNGFGQDTISDDDGSDVIKFGEGITLSNLRFFHNGNSDNLLIYVGSDLITIYDQFEDIEYGGSSAKKIESVIFADNSTFDLTGTLTFTGTNSGENIYDTKGSNTLLGLGGNDYLNGFAGNDILNGGTGNDSLQGDIGDDTYIYLSGDGIDTIAQDTSGTDTIRLGAGLTTENITIANHSIYDTKITFISGVEEIIVQGQRYTGQTYTIEKLAFWDGFTADFLTYSTWVWGTSSGQTTNGTTSADTILGREGNDTINGSGGNDDIHGGSGNDTLNGGADNDNIHGGDGNDTLSGDAGNDLLNGGDGVDTVTYVGASAAVTVTLSTITQQNTVNAGLDTILNIENIIGSGYNDTLTGDANDNNINGGNGNDTIEGGLGDDTLNGAGGTGDVLTYINSTAGVVVSLAVGTAQNTIGAGTDTISGFENLTGTGFADILTGDSNANTINGDAGDDVIEGGAGNDILTGGSGTDTVSYRNATAAVTVNIATLTAQNTVNAGTDTLSGFENILGSAYNDTLTGDANNNVIEGGAGNDILNGAGGTSDTVSYANAASGITVNLATTTSQNTGGAGSDTLSNFENILGSAHNDTLTGNSSNNIIDGGAGNDTLNGAGGTSDTVSYASANAGVTVNLATTTAQNTVGAGTDTLSNFENLSGSAFNDVLTGNSGANTLTGGAGNDTLNGAGGTDTIYGDAGNDILIASDGTDTLYGGADSDIFMFNATNTNSDTIADFSLAQNDKIDVSDLLQGYDPLTHAITDFVQITTSGSNSILKVDANGGANSFVQIATISGVTGLTDEAALVTSGNLVVT